MSKQSNILDPVNEILDPTVWEAPASPTPKLKLEHKLWAHKLIYDRFNDNGYDVQNWASFYVTGSLTTYQYSEDSDFDVSLFVNTDVFPDWSRAEMIAIAVEELDGNILPGTTHPLQVFVVPEGIQPKDLYKKGLRSGYDLDEDRWINPPDPELAEDPEVAYNAAYTHALEQADKMERLLKYEPHKAQTFWHQIHKRRRADQKAGKGDYAPSNIVYKMLANRGLLEEISDVTGEYIAKVGTADQDIDSLLPEIASIAEETARNNNNEDGTDRWCGDACEATQRLLAEHGIESSLEGAGFFDERGWSPHVWLRLSDGSVIDPTVEQHLFTGQGGSFDGFIRPQDNEIRQIGNTLIGVFPASSETLENYNSDAEFDPQDDAPGWRDTAWRKGNDVEAYPMDEWYVEEEPY